MWYTSPSTIFFIQHLVCCVYSGRTRPICIRSSTLPKLPSATNTAGNKKFISIHNRFASRGLQFRVVDRSFVFGFPFFFFRNILCWVLWESFDCLKLLRSEIQIQILISPNSDYFLSHIKYTRLGTSYNGFRERLHRNACEIERRARCSFGMSVKTTPCHFDDCPSGFQSLMYTNINNTCTSPSAIAHSLLPSLKVTKMSEAFVSKDVYEIYDMMEHIADHLGVKTQQLTRNLSPDAFCLVQSENDLCANTDRAMAARGPFNGLPSELQYFICDHLNDTKNSFSEILTELTPSPVSFSLY